MRGRFAWLGAAVVLLGLGGLATVGTQDKLGSMGFGIYRVRAGADGLYSAGGGVHCGAAGRIVLLRAFSLRIVERRDWLLAKIFRAD